MKWDTKTYDHCTGWYEEAHHNGHTATLEKGLGHRTVVAIDERRIGVYADPARARAVAENALRGTRKA